MRYTISDDESAFIILGFKTEFGSRLLEFIQRPSNRASETDNCDVTGLLKGCYFYENTNFSRPNSGSATTIGVIFDLRDLKLVPYNNFDYYVVAKVL